MPTPNTPPPAPPPAPQAAPTAAPPTPQAAVASRVNAQAVATNDAVAAVAAPQMAEVPSYSNWLMPTSFPSLPGGKKALKAVGTTLAIASPPVALAVGIPTWAGVKTWNKLKQYRPFSWVHNAGASIIGGASDALKSTVSVATYPLRLTGVAALNTLKFGARRGIDTLRFGKKTIIAFKEFVQDLLIHMPGEPKHILEKILDFPGWFIQNLFHKPVQTIIASMAVIGFAANPVLVIDTILKAVMRFLTYLAGGA